MDKRVNSGYVITDSIHVGNVEFVLGVNSSDPAQFVTWECRGGDNYYWGHYTPSHTEALRDLLDRAAKEIEIVEHRQARQTKKTEKDHER